MNEDYLDSLLQSILDMEETDEEEVPDAPIADPLSEQPSIDLMNQMAGQDLPGFAADNDVSQQGFGTGRSDTGYDDAGSPSVTDRGLSDTGYDDTGSQSVTDRGLSDTGYDDAGSQSVTDRGLSDTGYDDTGSQSVTDLGLSDTGYDDTGSQSVTDFGLSDTGYDDTGSQSVTDLGLSGTGYGDTGSPSVTGLGPSDTGMEDDGAATGSGQYQPAAGDVDMSDIDELLRSISDPNLSDNEADDSQMSENEIENLLRETKASAGQADQMPDDYSGGQDWQEIQDLLTKSDQNEAVDDDIISLLNSDGKTLIQDEKTGEGKESKRLSASEKKAAAQKAKEEKAAKKLEVQEAKKQEKEAKKAAKQAKKASRKKSGVKDVSEEDGALTQDNNQETDSFQMDQLFNKGDSFDTDQILSGLNREPEKSSKKTGWLSKILDFLLEEEAAEEEPQEEKPAKAVKEKKGGKGKKAKSESAKDKSSGGKKDDALDDDDREDSSAKKKKKKPKKEPRVPKVADSMEPPAKLPLKKVIAIGSLCASVGAAILVCSLVLTDYSARTEALKAYQNGDYMQCYMGLYGKKLNNQETLIFHKSESILKARLPIKKYQVLAERGQKANALDVLIQFVAEFPILQAKAEAWQTQVESQAAYEEVLGLLQSSYGLNVDQVLAIWAEPDDLKYTQMVTSIAQGKSFQQPGSEPPPEEDNPPMSDILPEEEGLTDVTFVEGV